MRLAGFETNYNNYAQNNELLKGSTSLQNPVVSKYGKTNTDQTTNKNDPTANKIYKTKEYEALNKLFEDMKKATSGLRERSERLSKTEKDSLFAKAKESGNKEELLKEVNQFAEQYNAMVSGMNDIGGTDNEAFLKELESYVNDNKELLENVGMKANKDGTLSVDKTVLENADVEELEKLFNSSASFASKVAIKSVYIEANAVINQQSNGYSSAYDNYNNYITQKTQDSPYFNYIR